MAPASVTEENEKEAWKNLYGNQNKTSSKPRFQIGDTVRREKLIFEKGYEQNWTRKIFTIYHILRRSPTVCKVKDLTVEVIREPQIVGDIQAPLLKIVKVGEKDGEVVNSHYTRPHYVSVIRQHFQTIELVLRLHSGDLVPFERGRGIAGYGIGGWFKRLFRSALPFLSRGAVGKEVLRTGAQIANDLLEGRNLQESAEERAKEMGRILAKKAIKKADDMLGKGKAYKRKKKLPKYLI
ncbi:uncharacterized protein TNIN_318751 [Trichonephila inaurata madagascariensis]|uniref:Uncharacterized protein n=1 Tax=Trichonephila inaurata madagascariensis TaxID=2747483 RepID=A0A8X6XVK8_9ARAC|nr:uncharacterized protein TNIN_318751 [Trichonephila inaurata madagascariensis]